MANLNDYGALMLASRMRKLSEQMYNGVDQSYKAAGIDFPSRCSSLLLLLRDNGPTPITTLAAQIGQTHPAVIQLSRRLLALSDHGRALMDNMAPLWDDILAAVDVALDGHTDALMATLGRLETRLQETPFADIIAGRRRQRELAAVEIIDYAPQHAVDFHRLNIEWLERFFYVEEHDNAVLSDPQTHILDGGGAIFLARLHGDIVGACALIEAGDGRVELSKMAVTPRCQGLGVGRRLIERAIAAFQAGPGTLLYLESNSKLETAVRLYERSGFQHTPKPASAEAHYQRANVYMEWLGLVRPMPSQQPMSILISSPLLISNVCSAI